MESVMNFLADYYIWFFVAALVLCFALIGFIIESKKKQKNEFKGESIEDSSVTNNLENTIPVENINKPATDIQTESVQVVDNTAPIVDSSTLQEVSDETMEINDIPIMNDESKSSIEYYNGPIDMPTPSVKPVPEPLEEINTDFSNVNVVNNDFAQGTSYMQDTQSVSNMFGTTSENVNLEEKQENESVNIFNDIK